MDHAANGVRAIERALLTPQDLDPRTVISNEGAEIKLTIEGVGNLNPIDQNQRVVGLTTAHSDLGQTRRDIDRKAWNITQDISDVAGLALGKGAGIQHRHGRSQQMLRNGDAGPASRHDQLSSAIRSKGRTGA